MDDADDLIAVLSASQDLGFLGARPVAEVIEHARAFVRALDGVTSEGGDIPAIIDLGSGGGVPGLVIAHDRPDLQLTLLDRRAKRTDFLERMVRRLGWSDRVRVICDEADRAVAREPARYTAAVARGFGPPELTLALGAAFVRPGGRVIISEPPEGDRWDTDVLTRSGVIRDVTPGHDPRVAVFLRQAEEPLARRGCFT